MVSCDRDFIRLHSAGIKHGGIVAFMRRKDVGYVCEMLEIVHVVETLETIRGRVIFL